MNYIYVIQDGNYEAVAATFCIAEALKLSRSNAKFSYREIPFINSDEFQVTHISQPISPKYLPKNADKK